MIRPISFNGVYKINNATHEKVTTAVCQINNTIGRNDKSLGYKKLDEEISKENPCFFACESEVSPSYILTGDEAKAAKEHRETYENNLSYFSPYFGNNDMIAIEYVMASEMFYEQIGNIIKKAYSNNEVEVLEMDFDDSNSQKRPTFKLIG